MNNVGQYRCLSNQQNAAYYETKMSGILRYEVSSNVQNILLTDRYQTYPQQVLTLVVVISEGSEMGWDRIKQDLSLQLVDTLSIVLPMISKDNWWQSCVINNLSYAQQEKIGSMGCEDLVSLDLAALLRVCERNWGDICFYQNFSRDGVNLIKELRNVRNRWAHQGAVAFSFDDIFRDLDTSLRFVEAISGSNSLIERINSERTEALLKMTEEHDSQFHKPHHNHVAIGGKEPIKNSSSPPTFSLDDNIGTIPTDEPINKGVNAKSPLGSLKYEPELLVQLKEKLSKYTYIGIDFGTSTTVTSFISLNDESSMLIAEAIPIEQSDGMGRLIESHIVPSCLAWVDGKLLVGSAAARMRVSLTEGTNVWSSFKMGLGVNLGPQYTHTQLKRGVSGHAIECPQDACREFFLFLRNGIETAVKSRGLPHQLRYVVSVPASFEANQRQDLINSLAAAGISVDASTLIDEPNAAFLSYLQESLMSGSGLISFLEREKRNLMVFDFGAGTCDISILQISSDQGRIESRNLAVSRFLELGGNNIDETIARNILLPQLLACSDKQISVSSQILSRLIMPRLFPEAENLKIQCCKILTTRGLGSLSSATTLDDVIIGNPIPPLTIDGIILELTSPSINFKQFAHIMEQFVISSETPEAIQKEHGINDRLPISIFRPIKNALKKAKLAESDLHAILFVGGSSENPIIRESIRDHFGRFVECLTPIDLRAHVSQGASLHSLMLNGLGLDMIHPITSEPILLVTNGGGLREILPSGSTVPSEKISISDFTIDRDGQPQIDLPLCVSNENKILAVISVQPDQNTGFLKGDRVKILCNMNRNKLLEISVSVNDTKMETALLNPLANRELTPSQQALLKSRHKFNHEIIEGNGTPSSEAVREFAEAALLAKEFVIAAEMYEAVERLDPGRDFATNICYCWSKAKRMEKAEEWAKKGYEIEPNCVNSYNLGLICQQNQDSLQYEKMMKNCLILDAEYAPALVSYGHYLLAKKDSSGITFLKNAVEILSSSLDHYTINEDDCIRLQRTAVTLALSAIAERAKSRRDILASIIKPYEDEHLVTEGDTITYNREST